VLVFADNATQISRIKLRDKLSNTDALNRINSQMPLEKKKEFANIIIDNNKDLESTKNQVDEVIEFFKSFI
ncbi:MAG: dephospho-CoA kinase, partial [Clostridium sp.]